MVLERAPERQEGRKKDWPQRHRDTEKAWVKQNPERIRTARRPKEGLATEAQRYGEGLGEAKPRQDSNGEKGG
jgi:hypothetical protein